MIEAEGIVVRTESSMAFVETQRASACGSCSSKSSCGTSSLAGLMAGKSRFFKVQNPVGAVVGETVVVGLDERALLRGSLALYALPLLMLIAGAVAAGFLAPSVAREGYSIAGAAAGLAAGVVGVRIVASRLAATSRYQPVIMRRIFQTQVVRFSEGKQ